MFSHSLGFLTFFLFVNFPLSSDGDALAISDAASMLRPMLCMIDTMDE